MGQISNSDTIFGTLVMRGVTIASASVSGIGSLDQLVACMRRQCPGMHGFATLSVRNSTGGWSRQQSVYLR